MPVPLTLFGLMGNWLGVEKGQAPLVCPVHACQVGNHSLVLSFAPSTKELSRCRNASLKIFKAKKLLPGGELERRAALAPVRTEEARFS
ncbi:UNVERIFIED_CONTAM: hypothetical protein Sradi_6206000 [Sesamum radiatum]|uniref:Uncharacterized protein n=1 Tax=Sesamum radiatum TaxID=300843 RepID=A0AAW2K9L8_SESRA